LSKLTGALIDCIGYIMKTFLKYISLFPLILIFFFIASCNEKNINDMKLKPFEKSDLWGYKNEEGKVIIEPQFVVAYDFYEEGIALVADYREWKYIDKTGATIIKPYVIDNGPDSFSNGLARFTELGKIGFFDKNGDKIVPAIYDYALPFSDSMAVFCMGCKKVFIGEHTKMQGGNWGYIDMKGFEVIPATYEEAESFNNGTARVMIKGSWFIINKRGKIIE